MQRRNNLKKQLVLITLAVAVLAFLFGLWSKYNTSEHKPEKITLQSGTAFDIPKEIRPFALQNAANGQPFTNESLKGHWTMLFFGFTNCASLCPTTLTTLNQFYTSLETDHVNQLPQVVFISIDPERDTLTKIKAYVTSFNKNFNGATAEEAQIDKMTQELNILFSKANPNNDENYQIDHSGTVLVINPQGHLSALFSPPIDAKALAADYKTLIEATPEN